MQAVFIQILNMSYRAGIVVCFILLARWVFLLCKIPKKYAYFIWFIPYIRFLCPFSLESIFHIFPKGQRVFQLNSVGQILSQNLENSIGNFEFSPIEFSFLAPTPENSVDPIQVVTFIGSSIWLAGVTLLVLYSIISLIRLKSKLQSRIGLRDNIYLTDEIDMPFVMGIIKQKIYLPSNITKEAMEYVILHEQTHIKRRDSLIKGIAFFVTILHWFNPLAWVSFFCMGSDMEMSCDETVIKQLGEDSCAPYAQTLLSISLGRKGSKGMPLAFGEGNVKNRIKNIMQYKKPLFFTGIFAGIFIVILSVGLLANPVTADIFKETNLGKQNENVILQETTGETSSLEVGQKEELPIEEIEITIPQISPDMIIGADGVHLDYAENGMIIFHDYFGLFVYAKQINGVLPIMMSMPESVWSSLEYGIVGAIDLKAIGCHYTQGDNYCEVRVSVDGSMVYLHPISQEEMYVYDVYNKKLIKQKYSLDGIELFDSYISLEEMEGVEKERICSANGILFENGKEPYYGYLVGDGTIGSLSYLEWDMIIPLFVSVPENPVKPLS